MTGLDSSLVLSMLLLLSLLTIPAAAIAIVDAVAVVGVDTVVVLPFTNPPILYNTKDILLFKPTIHPNRQ